MDGHIIHEPILLNFCGSNARKKCIENFSDEILIFNSCNEKLDRYQYFDVGVNDLIAKLLNERARSSVGLSGRFQRWRP